MTTVTSQCSNNIYYRQRDYRSQAHQLQYSVQLLYNHTLPTPLVISNPTLGSTTILDDNHQLQIALLASSVTIELVASSSRVTSAKFQPKVLYSYRDTRTGQDQGHLGPPDSGKKVTDFYITLV